MAKSDGVFKTLDTVLDVGDTQIERAGEKNAYTQLLVDHYKEGE